MSDPKTPSGFWVPVDDTVGEPVIQNLAGMPVKTFKAPFAAIDFWTFLAGFLPGAAVTTNIDKPNDYIVRIDPEKGEIGVACFPQA
jgi:hypothetical protein